MKTPMRSILNFNAVLFRAVENKALSWNNWDKIDQFHSRHLSSLTVAAVTSGTSKIAPGSVTVGGGGGNNNNNLFPLQYYKTKYCRHDITQSPGPCWVVITFETFQVSLFILSFIFISFLKILAISTCSSTFPSNILSYSNL